jgi:hypothetical protein
VLRGLAAVTDELIDVVVIRKVGCYKREGRSNGLPRTRCREHAIT